MININTIPTTILIKGAVDIKVYDALDVERMEPKVSIVDYNDTNDWIMERIIDAMHSSSGGTTYHLNTSSDWFSGRYPGDNNSNTVTDRDGENGILAKSSITTGYFRSFSGQSTEPVFDLFMHSNKSTSNVTNSSIWTAEAIWGESATTTISSFELGKDYSNNAQDVGATFAEPFAVYNVTNFTMQTTDILRITWTVAIG